MESYKHSCPFCGQHIEYTVGYCGKQMVCPICGKMVTFPAVPPRGKGEGLHIKRPASAQAKKWFFDFKGINFKGFLAPLNQFKHWNIVFVCLVPFLIVGALLVGAAELRNHFGSGPAMPDAPIVHADTGAWQKMTDLARADQLVQQRLVAVVQARAAAAAAEQTRATRHAYYHGQTLDSATYNGVMIQLHADEQAAANAQAALGNARQSFENAFQNYQRLGGTIDYRQQLPQ
jgi:hypothetical protein